MFDKKILIHQIMMSVDHFLQENNKKVIGLMKDELGQKNYDRICSHLGPKKHILT